MLCAQRDVTTSVVFIFISHKGPHSHIPRLLGSRQDEGGKNQFEWAFHGAGQACKARQGLCVHPMGLAGLSVEILPPLLVLG